MMRKIVFKELFQLEVHTDGGEEGAGVGGVEVVVGDVGQTEVVAHLGIEEVVLNTTTQADAAIEALEAFIVERAVGLALAEVLDLAGHAQRHIAAKEGLDAERSVDIDLIFAFATVLLLINPDNLSAMSKRIIS